MKMFAFIASILSLLGSTSAFARDVVLQAGQSIVACVDEEFSPASNSETAMMKMNQLLAQKTIVVPGTANFSVVYILQAPFTASAPSLVKLDEQGQVRMCVTLTQL